MVVLAASIISKSGKVLVSRQFVDISQIRIDGLLEAFPKLIGTGKQQHTYVETENVRYVYQPMETFYLLLVTTKQSNILEDLETLRLLSKLVPEYANSLNEESVCRAASELIFAFDEVISLGHKEYVTVAQVKQCCEMESHEEKLHKLAIQSKINETKEFMKRKANEIAKSKIERREVIREVLECLCNQWDLEGLLILIYMLPSLKVVQHQLLLLQQRVGGCSWVEQKEQTSYWLHLKLRVKRFIEDY